MSGDGGSGSGRPDHAPIRVLVVDDSAVVRKVLSQELSRQDDIDVVGTAMDPYAAREQIVALEPEVLTLDIEMPKMDGLSFLEKLMEHRPLPVVVVSSLAPKNSRNALRALRLGAVEVVPKPGSQFSVPDVGDRLAQAVRAAAVARLGPSTASGPAPADGRPGAGPVKPAKAFAGIETTHKVIAVGASTGGTRALESIVGRLPPDAPGTVVVQHMPEGFTRSFAERLDERSAVRVRQAADGDPLAPGLVLLAPGGSHLVLKRSGARYVARLKDGPPVHHQKPAVDVLFRSVARSAGRNAVGALLTGMGKDGASGLLEMRRNGAHTLAQDERSCVVFGMPKAAIEMDAAAEVCSLQAIPRAMLRALKATPAAEASLDSAGSTTGSTKGLRPTDERTMP